MRKLTAFLLAFLFSTVAFGQSTLTPNTSLQIPAYQQTNWQVPIIYDLNLLDGILGGTKTLPAGVTPSVGSSPVFVTANTSSTVITNLLNGFNGQTVRIFCGDVLTSWVNSSFIKLVTSPVSCGNSYLSITFTNINGVWNEDSHSGGPVTPIFYQTIQNPSSTPQTQRATIQFTGTAVASITDDAGNNRTIVTLTANAGSGVTIQTNSVNNSSQTSLNLLNSSATNGITLTVTNTSAGNVQLGFTGTLTDAGLTSAYSGVGSCGANNFVTGVSRNASPSCAQPSFANISGTLSAGQIPPINLASSSNGGVTGNLPAAQISGSLPVSQLTPGTNGQCVITSSSATIWGSCAGTAGVQTLSVNTTAVTVNASTTANQNLMSYTFSAGSLNSLGKTFRITSYGFFNSFLNTTETVQLSINMGSIGQQAFQFTPTGTPADNGWSATLTCTVTTTGANGAFNCYSTEEESNGNGASNSLKRQASSTQIINQNLTANYTVQHLISFNTGSTSNSVTQTTMVVELLN